jgi:hypothetical protein
MADKTQIEMDFEPGLTDQFPEFIDLLAACVYGSRIGLSGVATELDKSPSLLSRMLNRNPDDQRHLPASDLPALIRATGDKRPVYWLVEKFLEDSDTKHKRAMADLAKLLPQIQQLVMTASKK